VERHIYRSDQPTRNVILALDQENRERLLSFGPHRPCRRQWCLLENICVVAHFRAMLSLIFGGGYQLDHGQYSRAD